MQSMSQDNNKRTTQKVREMRYEKVTTETEARELLEHLKSYKGPVGLDTETTGVDPTKESPAGRGKIFCWSLATATGGRRDVRSIGTITSAESYYIHGRLLPLFASYLETAPLVGHNIHGFDRHLLANHGIEATNIIADTQRMFRLYEPSTESSAGLKALSRYWLGFHQPSFKSITMRPEHRMEDVVHKLRKGEVGPVMYRHTRRKVGDVKGIPTLLAAGPLGKFVKKLEYIPLHELEEMYPERWQEFVKYAALDAGLTLEIYQCLKLKLTETKWRMPA